MLLVCLPCSLYIYGPIDDASNRCEVEDLVYFVWTDSVPHLERFRGNRGARFGWGGPTLHHCIIHECSCCYLLHLIGHFIPFGGFQLMNCPLSSKLRVGLGICNLLLNGTNYYWKRLICNASETPNFFPSLWFGNYFMKMSTHFCLVEWELSLFKPQRRNPGCAKPVETLTCTHQAETDVHTRSAHSGKFPIPKNENLLWRPIWMFRKDYKIVCCIYLNHGQFFYLHFPCINDVFSSKDLKILRKFTFWRGFSPQPQ